ncbi:sulfotransferase family protein [Tahibacter aquaticus]|uniref:Sulfotransferase family protein n=1 Tax=Tahibacter aquaticus TaxID=520092 RepID=A0A4R6Z062_9GAMM|nr:sulfotransferase [Tahibacter aquaticus]TDR44900.1 sulfotransferase family protein [Tahibacter aquaticus]
MSIDDYPPPPPWLDRCLGTLLQRWPGLMRPLSRLETASVADAIATTQIEAPVYIAGMARSGSTVLLEMLAGLPGFVSLRYSDYPLHWLPYWWNALRQRLPLPPPALAERAHRDRLQVGPHSPEAFEETFWQAFFPGRHDEALDQHLGRAAAGGPFAAFYRDQLRKLLAVRQGRRYLCKGNYNIARLACLQALFADARFLVPVREPVAQVASLLKQDRWFCRWSAADPRIGRHLARLGHYEFGPFKRVQHCGDGAAAQAIRAAWDSGDTALGYALQWNQIYAALLRQLDDDAALQPACLIVGYEALCADPAAGIARIAAHIGLDAAQAAALTECWAPRLSLPAYYDDGLDAAGRARIEAITATTWAALQNHIGTR